MQKLIITAIALSLSACASRQGVTFVKTPAPAPRVVDEITIVKFQNQSRVDVVWPVGPNYAPSLADFNTDGN